MRAKREGTGLDSGRQDDDDVVQRLSMRSTSTGSSLLSDISRSEPLSSSSQSEPNRQPPLPGYGHNRNISGGGCADSICECNVKPQLVDELRSRGTWQQDSVDDSKDAVDTMELDAIFRGAPGCGMLQKKASKGIENNVHTGPRESPVWAELSYGSGKKMNTSALNAVSISNSFPICQKHPCACGYCCFLCFFALLSNTCCFDHWCSYTVSFIPVFISPWLL